MSVELKLAKESMRYFCITILLVLGGCDQRGRYQIEATTGSTPNDDRVWVLDTKTGRVSLCYEDPGAVKCLQASAIPSQKNE